MLDPRSAESTEPTDTTDVTDMTDAPDVTDMTDAPEAPETPDVTDMTDAPEAPDVTDAAGTPTPEPEPVAATRAPRTVGRVIADALRVAGVRYAFTVPGESFLGLLDVLEESGIRVVATRHEGAAAFMAEAHGQLTGRPAVCLATRAVGGANLAIGIHTARQDSAPLFAVVGQVERAAAGREAFQEADLVGSIGRLAKWAAEIGDPADATRLLEEGVRAALGDRPGPVLLSVPEDVFDERVAPEGASPIVRPPSPRAEPADVRAVLQMLASAERPVILAGGGVLRARTSSDLIKLAELLHVPVVAGWRRPDVVSNDHPLYLGMAGLSAPPVVRERLERADAMLVLGSRLSEITSYRWTIPGPATRWAHVDLEPRAMAAESAGLRPPDLAIRSDARSFVRLAVQRLQGAVLDAALVETRRAANEADRAAWEEATVVDAGSWDGPGVHPGRIIATLRRVLPDEAILTTDAGNFGGWAARGFRFRRPGTFIGPTSGAMGYGLPAAIAASLVHRDRAVVALCGDGGLGMTLAELETAVRAGTRVIVLVFDNERFGTIRMYQDRRGVSEPAGTDLGSIDFAAVARACGARGVRVDADAAFEQALRQALASDRPTLIHLPVDRRWVSVDDVPV
jgi:acetolactate synthase-1/2/3 large subunit